MSGPSVDIYLQILINGSLLTYPHSLQLFHGGELISKLREIDVSIIIPTYNESENILKLIDAIKVNLPDNIITEVIIVDDNSPDGTGSIVEDYIRTTENSRSLNSLQLNTPHKFEGNSVNDLKGRQFK